MKTEPTLSDILAAAATEQRESPESLEIRDLARRCELTGTRAGALLGVSSRTWRRWLGGDRPMPWATWFAFQVLTASICRPRP